MKIWRILDPYDSDFAQAGIRGTWTLREDQPERCPDCGRSGLKLTSPVLIEWIPGSEKIGDFVWADAGVLLAQESVFMALEKSVGGFVPGPVEMVESKGPAFDTVSKGQPVVSLPYQGPELHHIQVTQQAELDQVRSTIEVVSSCDTCGHRRRKVRGIERVEMEWDQEALELVKARVPRTVGMGLFVEATSLDKLDVFKLEELPGWLLCTTAVKDEIRSHQFSNIDFFEVGEILEK